MKRSKTLRERAAAYANKQFPCYAPTDGKWETAFCAYLAGASFGKKEGKAEAMKACGWGDR